VHAESDLREQHKCERDRDVRHGEVAEAWGKDAGRDGAAVVGTGGPVIEAATVRRFARQNSGGSDTISTSITAAAEISAPETQRPESRRP